MICRSVTVVFSALLCILIIRTVECKVLRLPSLGDCHKISRCTTLYDPNADVVYAIDNGVCKTFVNNCEFIISNCERSSLGLSALEVVPRETCIQFCPVCKNAEYKRSYEISKCLVDREACLSGNFPGRILNIIPMSTSG